MKKMVWTLMIAACLIAPLGLTHANPKNEDAIMVKASMRNSDLLKVAKANQKRVTVRLKNGAHYTAFVQDVSSHAVVLTELSGKSFFDAYIELGEIAAIEIQVRK